MSKFAATTQSKVEILVVVAMDIILKNKRVAVVSYAMVRLWAVVEL